MQVQLPSIDQEIDQAFLNLYQHLLNPPLVTPEFRHAAIEFFDRSQGNTALHDRFFSNFGPLSFRHFQNERWHRAEKVWEEAVKLALEWESRNPGEYIHKGTPFYFCGMAAISRGELDKGYLLMHQALEEDIRTNNAPIPDTPAFAFATLDYTKIEQAFRHWTLYLADFLEGFLNTYRTSRAHTLQIDDFRTRFLARPDDLDNVFLFTYTLGRLFLLSKAPEYALKNRFTGQLELNLLFDLTLVSETLIKLRNPNPGYFPEQALYLSGQAGLGLNQHLLKEYSNQEFRNDFQPTVESLLDGRFVFDNGTRPSPMVADLVIAYGLRNYGAHHASSEEIVWQRFEELRQCMLNVLFFSVEVLL
jgi:hypothetical protein